MRQIALFIISILFVTSNTLEADAISADKITIKGAVKDIVTGDPLVGAGLVIEGTSSGAVTDLDGNYELSLPSGNISVSIFYIGYKPETVMVSEDGSVVLSSLSEKKLSLSDISYSLEILLTPDTEALEDAVVTARKNLESLKALQNERMNSGYAIENIGAKEMALKGISNAEESVSKLSGISIADAGQLIVRGLGDRYSTTTLNGLPIASPNPDNKLIPLDIFPASTIQNITVSKVYEASSFADYSGAHVDIGTKEGTDGNFLNISFSTGGLFNTVFGDSYRMDRPSLFRMSGLDKKIEKLPYSQFGPYSRSTDIFGTGFSSYKQNSLPDLNGSVGFGHDFKVGNQHLGLLLSASVKSGSETVKDAFYRTYEASAAGSIQSEYNYDSYTDKIDLAALLNLEYSLRSSDHIGLTVFFARNAKSTFLDRSGYDYQESYDLIGKNQVSHFYMLRNYQLAGHHEVGNWLLDWGVSCGISTSDEPDRRQVMFRRGEDGSVKFFQLNRQETQRYFGKLKENEAVADIKATYDFGNDNILRFGITAKDKSRHFGTTRFYYDLRKMTDPLYNLSDLDSYIGFESIRDGLVEVDRKQHKRDSYDASNTIGAAFIETDWNFGEHWSLNAGLRLEASRQSVDYNDDVEDLTRNLDALDLFPAVNLKYSMERGGQLRLSLSRTITRPSFVEMAPFLYQESFGGAQIRGNEALKNGYNYNLDLRYELFSRSDTDMFSVTGYFKYLDTPVERTQRLSGGATEHSFQNADNGLAAGVEVEFRKQIVKDLAVSANASYMYTNVSLPDGGAYTNMQRSLQGASPYLVNADISWTPKFKKGNALNMTLLYNLQGPRIHAVGIMGLGDVKQMPFHSLDFASGYEFGNGLSLTLSFRNLLNSSVRYRQDIPNAERYVDVEKWKMGTGFEIGISWKL